MHAMFTMAPRIRFGLAARGPLAGDGRHPRDGMARAGFRDLRWRTPGNVKP